MMDSTSIGISARSHDASQRLTFEAGLWAAVVGVAALLRLWTLNSAPLANPDASAALAGLAILRGETVPLTNPLYGTLLAVIFGIFGASDASARLVGCIVGIALCALPAVMRIDIGRVRALLFGALLAISPTLWFVSRQVDGALLAWALAIGAWVAWRNDHAVIAWALAGALLACGSDAVSPGLMLIIVLAIGNDLHRIQPTGVNIAWLVATFVVCSTAFGLRLAGLGDAFEGYAQWLHGMTTAGPLTALRGLAGFAIYEPLAWLGAAAGMFVLASTRRTRSSSERFEPWLAWIMFGLALFILTQSREVNGLVPVVFGCASLAAVAGQALMRGLVEKGGGTVWAIAGLSLVMLVYGHLGFSMYAGQGFEMWLLTALIALLMVAGIAIVAALTFDTTTALSSVGLALASALLLYTLSAGIQLNHTRPDNPAEPYVVEATPRSMSDLVATIEQLSVRTSQDAHAMRIDLAEGAPDSLKWALRDQRQLSSLPNPGASGVALTPAGAPPDTGGAFVGSGFDVASAAQLSAARCDLQTNPINCLALAQWLAARDLSGIQHTQWVLWLNQEMALKASGLK